MKTVVLSMILLALPLLNSCSKDENNIPQYKDVTYEAKFDKIEGNSDLILKGEYVDQTGKKVSINGSLPFKVELKNVPLTVKTGFKGYVFSIKASKIIGVVKMTVKQMPMDRVSYDNIHNIEATTNAQLGFTGEELKAKTSFDFSE